MKPILLEDNISRIFLSALDTQMGIARLEALSETKLLDYNEDKTRYVLFGSGRTRKDL